MNVRDLISSGKLEEYVAGVLPEQEMKEISALALIEPELAEEIRRIETAVVEYYTAQNEKMSEFEMEKNVEAIFARSNFIAQKTPVVNLVEKKNVVRIDRWLAAAVIAGLLLTSATAILTLIQNNRMSKEIADIKAKQEALISENKSYQDSANLYQQRFEIVKDILAKRVELSAVDKNPFTQTANTITKPGNFILLYWQPNTKKILMVSANLPDLSPEQQYQLWGMVDGKPVDAGVFEYRNNQVSMGFQKDISNASAFAVTVEPRGGSKEPTISNLCMMGKL
ncbi:MAG: hypothetical protein C5B52_03370 [Bacteroidetes bacterium]|nr:MAG: hypothetical protein C5B52_03370 [Bacteroidota bacterium]